MRPNISLLSYTYLKTYPREPQNNIVLSVCILFMPLQFKYLGDLPLPSAFTVQFLCFKFNNSRPFCWWGNSQQDKKQKMSFILCSFQNNIWLPMSWNHPFPYCANKTVSWGIGLWEVAAVFWCVLPLTSELLLTLTFCLPCIRNDGSIYNCILSGVWILVTLLCKAGRMTLALPSFAPTWGKIS